MRLHIPSYSFYSTNGSILPKGEEKLSELYPKEKRENTLYDCISEDVSIWKKKANFIYPTSSAISVRQDGKWTLKVCGSLYSFPTP